MILINCLVDSGWSLVNHELGNCPSFLLFRFSDRGTVRGDLCSPSPCSLGSREFMFYQPPLLFDYSKSFTLPFVNSKFHFTPQKNQKFHWPELTSPY